MEGERKRKKDPPPESEPIKKPCFRLDNPAETAEFMELHTNEHLRKRILEVKRDLEEYRLKYEKAIEKKDQLEETLNNDLETVRIYKEQFHRAMLKLAPNDGKEMTALAADAKEPTSLIDALFQAIEICKNTVDPNRFLSEEAKEEHAQLEELEHKLEDKSKAYASLHNQFKAFSKKLEEAEASRNEAEDRLEAAHRKIDKLLLSVNGSTSSALPTMKTKTVNVAPVPGQAKKEESIVAQEIKKEHSLSSKNMTNGDNLLSEDIAEKLALGEKAILDLEKLNKEYGVLLAQLNGLKLQLNAPLSEDRVKMSGVYVELQSQMAQLKEQHERINQEFHTYKTSVKKDMDEREKRFSQFKQQQQAKITQLDSQVQTISQDNTRMRKERRQLAFHLEQAKTQTEHLRTCEEYNQLVDWQSKELDRIRREYQKQLESHNTDEGSADLIQELDAIGKAYQEIEQKYKAALQRLDQKNELKKLEQEMSSLKSSKMVIEEANSSLRRKISKLEEDIGLHDTLVNQERQKNRALEDILNARKERIAMLEDERNIHFQRVSELEIQTKVLSASIHELQDSKVAVEKLASEYLEQLQAEKQKVNELEEQMIKLKHSSSRSRDSKNLDNFIEEELKEIKEKLKCPLCLERNKDVVIARCFHVFCNACIQTIINLRQRKCPRCGIAFSQNDVKSVFLV